MKSKSLFIALALASAYLFSGCCAASGNGIGSCHTPVYKYAPNYRYSQYSTFCCD